jgi:thiamine kinase-like enzyme
MSEQLPPQTIRKLEQTLAQWRQWQGADELPGAPHLVGQLAGISNYTVLAEAAGQRFCIRLDRVNPAANGLNRQIEWRALLLAHQAGFAPRPRYINPEIGALVCDYLPPDNDQSVTPESLARLLRGIHQLPRLHYRLDLNDRIRRYHRQLRNTPPEVAGALEKLDQATAPLLSRIIATAGDNRLCHNDISGENLLRSQGRLYALDWEYCAMGDPWLDLATGMLNSGLAPQDQEQLLHHYLQRPVTDRDSERMEECLYIVRYLELLWYLSQRPGYLGTEDIEGRVSWLLSAPGGEH